MSRADFDEFIERKQAEEKTTGLFDSKKRLAEWLHYLDQLYDNIEVFLSSYIAAKKAWLEFQEIVLIEDFSGPYQVRQMLLHITTSTIIFEPIGTMLIGSKGRVDVQGQRGRARLSLINRKITHARQLVHVSVSRPGDPLPSIKPTADNIDWVWKVISPPPELRFIDLDENSFFDMILSVADA